MVEAPTPDSWRGARSGRKVLGSLVLQAICEMSESGHLVSVGSKSRRKREPNGNQPEPNGSQLVALSYLRSQCGALFGRGFSLVAHREKLYVRTAGTKIPLFLDLSAPWQDVQRRAAALQDLLKQGPYDPQEWKGTIQDPTATEAGMGLVELEALWRRRKMAEGIQPSSYERSHFRMLQRLDERRPLSTSSIMRAIETTEPGSLNRARALSLYRNLAKASGHPWNGNLLDPLVTRGYRNKKRQTPLFTDQEIEEIVLRARGQGDLGWWRVFSLMAIYGLRPWEAWFAEPSKVHAMCVWIPIGKRNSSGCNPPREVPPFHRRWVELFDLSKAWKAPLPTLPDKRVAGTRSSKYLVRKLGMPPGEGKSPYGFRNAYARRIHSTEYRVTDGDGAAFMGHTVMIHNAVYRRWVAGYDDPIARYL